MSAPPTPRETHHGFPAAPMFYPLKLALVAEICRLLIQLEEHDAHNREGALYATGEITLWDADSVSPGEEEAAKPYGWLRQIDTEAWVFVPYVPEVEEGDREQQAHWELVGRRRGRHDAVNALYAADLGDARDAAVAAVRDAPDLDQGQVSGVDALTSPGVVSTLPTCSTPEV